jgi:hypothetical protein
MRVTDLNSWASGNLRTSEAVSIKKDLFTKQRDDHSFKSGDSAFSN